MTNITYFHEAIRESYSSSSASSSSSEHQAPPHHVGAAAEAAPSSSSSLYTAIGKAYLACVRPAIELEQQQEDDNDDSSTTIETISGSTFKRFDFHKLKTATKNFEATAALKGSHRSMFEAWVDGHKLTATKLGRGCIAVCVKVFNQQPSQDHTKFLGRVNCLAHIAHPNLVRLVGYGLEDTRRLLVYEFTSRGRLEDHLFERSPQNFTWSLHMKVALDAAKGLAFLHSLGKEIIHGFFNPYNILLDLNYDAKLSGFGLIKNRSTTFPEEVLDSFVDEDSYSINPANIHDPPEYRYTGQFSAKSDVFSFGVVFLEMLCGRRAFEDSQNLLELTESHSSRSCRITRVLDSRTMGQYSKNTIQKAIKLLEKCLSLQAKLRPTMDEVVQALEELQN